LHIGFHGGIATRVENLAAHNLDDFHVLISCGSGAQVVQ
jgi:hypothetical protein